MCGINGIFAYRRTAPGVEANELIRVRDSMAHRGPDGVGLWVSPDRRVGFAHRRLAIIDLSDAGAQPMCTPDRQVIVTFNGEIYNYRELRAELQAKGHQFRTSSDTEVLLHLYLEHGALMVDRLRGMFAFALWDEKRQGLLLARDPFGIKPLYYADQGGTIRFASQVKALLRGREIDTRQSAAGLVGFYLWGSVPEPHTMYKGIRSVPAGATLWADRDQPPSITTYFSVASELSRYPEQGLSRLEMREQLAVALADSVKQHMVADVPVGVFLSSGLDSSTIAALATQVEASRISSLTLGFKEFQGTNDDEVPLAAVLASHYEMDHHTHIISKADLDEQLEHICVAMDQPSIDGINTFFVSRAASQVGMKVALSGLGGDEIFGGYSTFQQVPKLVNAVAPFQLFPRLNRAFRIISAPVLKYFTSPKYAGVLEYGSSYGGAYMLRRGLYMPWELFDFIDADIVREGWNELQAIALLNHDISKIRSPHAKIAAMEMQMYMRNQLLRDSDWAGMAWSLEIRVPLVDKQLFRTIAPWVGTRLSPQKADLAASPRRSLPHEILARRKTGFSIPVRTWLEFGSADRGLRGWARRLVDGGSAFSPAVATAGFDHR